MLINRESMFSRNVKVCMVYSLFGAWLRVCPEIYYIINFKISKKCSADVILIYYSSESNKKK